MKLSLIRQLPNVAFIGFLLALALTDGCQSTPGSTASSVAAKVFTPANVAQGTQDIVAAGAVAFLANNGSYAGELQGIADAFTALASSNPGVLTAADINATLGKTPLSGRTQSTTSALLVMALGIWQRDFAVNLPGLKPNYAMFATAIANGLNTALGHPPAVSP